MLNIGVPGLILILIVTLVLFGPKKLPEVGRALGSSLREFKRSSQGKTSEKEVEFSEKPDAVLNPSNQN